ncbi:hypothetical protein [Endozoicomonas sp. Mp262]|uniref:hypothetical protein n=1 Tax=Endozoicomonas sp. Mp262 TaxID=2919499 RepID=UPI0021D7FE7B
MLFFLLAILLLPLELIADSGETAICKTCYSQQSTKKIVLTNCGHPFCPICLLEKVNSQLQNQLPLTCPDCTSDILAYDLVALGLSAAAIQKEIVENTQKIKKSLEDFVILISKAYAFCFGRDLFNASMTLLVITFEIPFPVQAAIAIPYHLIQFYSLYKFFSSLRLLAINIIASALQYLSYTSQ